MILCATAIVLLLWQRFDATQKSDETNPRWFMVDVKFISRATHFVPYPLLREIAAGRVVTQSAGIEYIGEEGIREIKGNFMAGVGCNYSLSYRYESSPPRTFECTTGPARSMECSRGAGCERGMD
jgi:hypothetical protein